MPWGCAPRRLLTRGFDAGPAFGVCGRPSAVLVDRNGNIASDLAVGAPTVLALGGAASKLLSVNTVL